MNFKNLFKNIDFEIRSVYRWASKVQVRSFKKNSDCTKFMVRYSRFLYKLVIKVKGRKIGRIENVTPIHQILLVRFYSYERRSSLSQIIILSRFLTFGKKIVNFSFPYACLQWSLFVFKEDRKFEAIFAPRSHGVCGTPSEFVSVWHVYVTKTKIPPPKWRPQK